MATERMDFRVDYSRSGTWHRWRLFSYGVQIATGLEKKNKLAREASRVAKAEHIAHIKSLALKRIDEWEKKP